MNHLQRDHALRVLISAVAAIAFSIPMHCLAAPEQVPSLADLSLEQLGNIVVTSVSRRPESLADAPASVYVISSEDIRRSGATSLPEALRLAPNLQVARADTNQYAISARGFNNVLANKLLVMIDGRTIYSPLFSGTFWEAQDVMLEDIDRIEVISGPGATLWGANAVNGVINIITRSAKDTQGFLLSAGGGNREGGGGTRYGGELGNGGTYRVYGRYFHRAHSDLETGGAIRDSSDRSQAGFRADWNTPIQTLTIQGDAYKGDIDQLPSARDTMGANVLSRWTRRWDDDASTQVQVYYDYTHREHPGSFEEHLSTFDIEAQHGMTLASIHKLLAGVGYRNAPDRVVNTAQQAFIPPNRTLRWWNAFVQDQIAFSTELDLIAGVKIENNIYTGSEFLPNVRLAWRPATNHMIWGAASRAVRSPSRLDRDVYLPGVAPYLLASNDTFESEVANVYELGYRTQVTPSLSYNATVFHTEYDRLRSVKPQAGGAVFANDIEGHSSGIEAWGSWRVMPTWLLAAGVTALRERWHVKPGAIDAGGLNQLGNDPAAQWIARTEVELTPQHLLNVAVRHVAALPLPTVPSYTAVDAWIAWRPSRSIEISLAGQNLTDPGHAEWGSPANRAELGRAFFLKVLWTP